MLKQLRALAVLVTLITVLSGGNAEAAPSQNFSTIFQDAVAALDRGALDEAVDKFEYLADQGFSHPDASFNRALAYVERSRTPRAEPGDLGRAAAALAEVLSLRPSDSEAERALDKVRAEIARRRSRQGVSPMSAKASLARAVVGVLREQAFSVLAAFGSLLIAIGVALRSVKKRPATELASALGIGIGLLLLVTCGGFTAAARHFRHTSKPAVVVVPEARLLDESGKAIVQKKGVPEFTAVPEGASVYVEEEQDGLSRIEWGTIEGYVTSSQVRVLATR